MACAGAIGKALLESVRLRGDAEVSFWRSPRTAALLRR